VRVGLPQLQERAGKRLSSRVQNATSEVQYLTGGPARAPADHGKVGVLVGRQAVRIERPERHGGRCPQGSLLSKEHSGARTEQRACAHGKRGHDGAPAMKIGKGWGKAIAHK
jgi:hypothetical protein